jgi:hypothetical protein
MKTINQIKTQIGLACALFAALAMPPLAQAQFTYTGGTLNADQTYDGLGVDSALNPNTIGSSTANHYIGSGNAGVGSLTVQSGTLTINGADFKVANAAAVATPPVGTLTVAAGATLNINQIGQWGGGVGQRGAGTLNINGGTLNWQTSGSTEQRFMIGNGGSGVGILNLNGGTLNNFFDPGQTLTDAERQFRMGSDGGQGIAYLNSGSWILNGNVPFTLGAKWRDLNTTPSVLESATVSTLNILDGSLIFTGIIASLDASKATFTVGANDKVNFLSSGNGQLSLQGWQQSDFLSLATAGKLQINGLDVSDLNGFSYSFSSGQGILTIPEPSTAALSGLGLLMGMMAARRRRA